MIKPKRRFGVRYNLDTPATVEPRPVAPPEPVTHKACLGCGNVHEIAAYRSGSGNTSYSRCPSCRKTHSHREYRTKPRRSTKDVKEALLQQFGAACSRCGYDEFHSALEFHHRNPKQKDSKVSQLVSRYCTTPSDDNWSKLVAECVKCDVLCSNCHQAHHAGEW